MPFQKGKEKTGGKKKGTPNKLTKTVKDTLLDAFNELQQDPKVNLVKWGKSNPTVFYQIAAKLIPTEISAKVEAGLTVVWNESHPNEPDDKTE